jgi:hypothetical protein
VFELTFYDFPAEHWKHLRTTNPIESTFATVRHRTIRSRAAYRTVPRWLQAIRCRLFRLACLSGSTMTPFVLDRRKIPER